LPRAEAEARRTLLVLLGHVRQFWIDDVLSRKLQGVGVLEPGRQILADAVEHPWERVLELPGDRSAILPAGKPMIQIFDEVNRALLILGRPGAGKTTTMLRLASELIDRCVTDPGAPVPVVLNLSTWTFSRTDFADWVVQELKSKYYVPERTSRSWLESYRLLLLLDGLDEVAPERRADCVTAINAFVEEWGVPGLLVCSRLDEYTALPVRLRLHGAVKLQPLTIDQVTRLLTADERLSALRDAMRQDADLEELARTPLMLDVMTTAYRGLSARKIMEGDGPSGNRLAHVFDTYVGRMFERRGRADPPYPRERTASALSWLADGMHRHAQSVFLIEQLQPSWLAEGPQRWLYIVSSRLVSGLALGLAFGLILQLTTGLFFGIGAGQLVDVAAGIGFGLLFGAAGGLLFGGMELLRLARHGLLISARAARPWQPGVDAAAYASVLGAAGGLIVGAIGGTQSVGFGVILGLVFGLFFGLRSRWSTLDADIGTVERLHWSWRSAATGGRQGFVVGGVAGLVMGAVRGPGEFATVVIFSLLLALMVGSTGGLAGALFTGLRSSIVQGKTVPNQGMWLSVRNALLGGGVVGATGAALLFAIYGSIWGLKTGAATGVVGGFLLGLLAALWFGGLDIVRHFTLRVVLRRTAHVPFDYAAFLDYAVSLAFLQRVGGGYMFLHRRLQDHFAATAGSAVEVRSREGAGEPLIPSIGAP
jgi:eukaryotic-like serine/threonine-protein kinase